ncbi:DUF4386 domain-containing protein [Chitinophagaceae bacterium LB-8]|uniref:DUF4386 domain-containing protein n=1 Tax=Paraflavisolibacter caeni TaxID=2982496 RepID=A0A9X2XYU8_9BACT|nr:DUF4386 domain-containing protein [Paraflavisolibacter caeni]MCU7551367.1 DUF4386 domain-containing protein [Paraflavisolibacter caeni]
MKSYNLLNQEEKSVQPSSQSTFTIGRTFGILLLLQLIAALTLPFILSKPVTYGSPAFLTAVAAHSFQIRSAVLLSFVGSGLTVYLGITAFQIFRHYNISVALLFVVVCAISCTLDIVQAGTIMSMLSISNAFVASGAANSERYEVIGAAIAAVRRSAHIMQLLAIGAWMFVFYISLLRFKLIPRVLAAIGVLGVTLQFIGVTLMMLLGYPSIGEMAMPLLPIQITVAVWLMIKGFNNPTLKSGAVSDVR